MTTKTSRNIQLNISELLILFKVSFKHASAERSVTESVLVEARSSGGEVGYGESCPRNYVTGETISSVKTFFTQHQKDIEEKVVDVDAVKEWTKRYHEEIDKNPAAWCAIELALLDVFAKEKQVCVEELLGLPLIEGDFKYTAVLGDSSDAVFNRQYQQYRSMEFTDFKIKLSGNFERDQKKLAFLKNYDCDKLRVRFDANNLWQDVDEAGKYLTDLNYPFFAVEEPLASKNIAALAKLAEQINSKIILDESLTSPTQMILLEGLDPSRWIINIRVSKMGGINRSLEVVKLARQQNIPIIVGAQVGETSLLTRAALTVANASPDLLIAQEGAFGTLLLEEDICQPSLMFGKGGKIKAKGTTFAQTPGFGLQVNANSLV